MVPVWHDVYEWLYYLGDQAEAAWVALMLASGSLPSRADRRWSCSTRRGEGLSQRKRHTRSAHTILRSPKNLSHGALSLGTFQQWDMERGGVVHQLRICLLYTSDAADDWLVV